MSTWHVDDTELTAYARRQLAPLQRASVEAHVGACPACRDVLTRVVAVDADHEQFGESDIEHEA